MRYWRKKHLKPKEDLKVVMVVATYKQNHSLQVLVNSLLNQTYSNLKVVVVHDGAWYFTFDFDPYRVLMKKVPERQNVFGHNCREYGREIAVSASGHGWFGEADVVGFTNGDNYYVPTYVEALISVLNQGYDLAYCNMIHSHKLWAPVQTELQRGKIDCGAWLCRSSFVSKVSWQSSEFAEDWHYLSRILDLKPRTKHVNHTLFVHN